MKKTAYYILTIMFSSVIVFHFLVVFQLIPYSIVWGGKLKSVSQMYLFEANSIIMGFLFLITILLKAKFLKWKISGKIVNIVLWFMFGLFILNTIGNLFSENNIEKAIMTPQTLIIAFLLLIILLKKDPRKEN
jgi:hypothetical protein